MGQPVQGLNPTAIDQADRIRLHITPFTPDLIDRIIPPSLKPEASDFSFHSLQTFPERGYGFVELPAMAAEKLKNKLNGTTLKGAKVKIEDAKPEKTKKRKLQDDGGDLAEAEKAARKRARRERKQQQEDGVLPGHELEEGRHVKRGWVDDAAKRSKSKRDGVEGIEGKKMKFKTVVPPNKTADNQNNGTEKKDKKETKEKERKNGKKLAVVKEFDLTRKPITTAVIVKAADQEATYEDGQGWVNGDGLVVEAETSSAKRRREKKAKGKSGVTAPNNVEKRQSVQTNSITQHQAPDPSSDNVDDESSVVSSSSDDSEERSPGLESSQSTPEPTATEDDSSGSRAEVHPLEALFKRAPADTTRPKPAPIDTTFNFFNSDAASVASQDDSSSIAAVPPQTPHTREDMEWRGLRSAAPTPDTAAFSRHSSFPFAGHGDDVDEDGDEQMGENAANTRASDVVNGEGKEESEFRKWFYEHRGDLNRGWKKRRREERKTKRQRENRKLSRRVL